MQTRPELDDRLFEAILAKDIAKISDLLTQEVNPSIRNQMGVSALGSAIVSGAGLDIINMLLNAKANVNDPIALTLMTTPLHLAVQLTNAELVQTLCKNGANPELKDAEGYTPLHRSVVSYACNLVPLLLHHGATFNCINNENETLHESYRSTYKRSFVKHNDKIFYLRPYDPEKDNSEFSMIKALIRAGMLFESASEMPIVLEVKKEDASLKLKARILGQGMRQEKGLFQWIPQEVCSHIIDFTSKFSSEETIETIKDSFKKP